MIKSKQLAEALYELSEQKNHDKIEDLDAKFFAFIKENKIEGELPAVLYHFEKIVEREQEKKGIVIETAHEIKEATAKHIKTFLKADELHDVVKIKEELIGGFRAKWGGKIYDASIMTGLKKLEEAIIK